MTYASDYLHLTIVAQFDEFFQISVTGYFHTGRGYLLYNYVFYPVKVAQSERKNKII